MPLCPNWRVNLATETLALAVFVLLRGLLSRFTLGFVFSGIFISIPCVSLCGVARVVSSSLQWEQSQERLRLEVPLEVRLRNARRAVRVAIWLAGAAGAAGGDQVDWGSRWARVAHGRRERTLAITAGKYRSANIMPTHTGPTTLFLVALIQVLQAHAWFAVSMPALELEGVSKALICALVTGLIARLVVNFFRATLTHGGAPGADDGDAAAASANGGSPGGAPCKAARARRCGRCQAPKPPRCHHCSRCGCCVLKMDHHCLFINNCVGLHNYPQFLSYVFDCVLACTFQGACLLLPVMDSIDEGLDNYSLSKFYALLLFLYCALATFMMVRLLLDHLHQILRDVTTLEEMEADRHEGCSVHGSHGAAEPDSATALDNFSSVCGRPPAWCCPAVACIFKAFLCTRRKSWFGKAAKLD